MENKEKCYQDSLIQNKQVQQVKDTTVLNPRRKLFRRRRSSTSFITKISKRKIIKKSNKDQSKSFTNQHPQVVTVDQNKDSNHSQSISLIQNQNLYFKKALSLKISFDPTILATNLHVLYQKKQKLKNTDLFIKGCKFITEFRMQLIQKWETVLIVYQQPYKQNQRVHFGLILKYGKRLITFDGVQKLWPIKSIQKSYHWAVQEDTWSCGYRVLFWIKKIQQQGIEKWINEFEIPMISKNQNKIAYECF